ncbi:membrane protein [Bacteroidia bacterium]|nr:membrane protein [Bacteroidia bacterium]
MMKNYSIILQAVLFIAVIVLYILHFTYHLGTANEEKILEDGTLVPAAAASKVVYLNTDSLLSKYTLSIELNEAFLKKQEDRSTELNIKAKDIDRQANEYQKKLENNGFFTRERAEATRNDLLKKQYQLEQLRQEMTEKMMKEQSDLNKQLIENITNFLKEYNKGKGYDIILGTVMAGTVLYSETGFDITHEVIEKINEEYKKSSQK